MTGTTCDTSVLVPALSRWHPEHQVCRPVLPQLTGLLQHVVLEAYSVLSRLPAPHRVAPADAARLLSALGLEIHGLPGPRTLDLTSRMAGRGIAGGAVYDGLVAATAVHHDLRLLTRAPRARAAYDVVGVGYTML